MLLSHGEFCRARNLGVLAYGRRRGGGDGPGLGPGRRGVRSAPLFDPGSESCGDPGVEADGVSIDILGSVDDANSIGLLLGLLGGPRPVW